MHLEAHDWSCGVLFYPVSVDEPLAARARLQPLLAGVFQHVHQQWAVHLVGEVQGRVTLRRGRRVMMVIREQQQQQQRSGRGFTWMFWASTLAPAASRTCAESTLPASTAQWSGVLRFSLSAALTEAWFLIRKLLGSALETRNHSANQHPSTIWILYFTFVFDFYVCNLRFFYLFVNLFTPFNSSFSTSISHPG